MISMEKNLLNLQDVEEEDIKVQVRTIYRNGFMQVNEDFLPQILHFLHLTISWI